jgi:hypothetical protein
MFRFAERNSSRVLSQAEARCEGLQSTDAKMQKMQMIHKATVGRSTLRKQRGGLSENIARTRERKKSNPTG